MQPAKEITVHKMTPSISELINRSEVKGTTTDVCGPAGGYAVVQEEGPEEPTTVKLNFVGSTGTIAIDSKYSGSTTTTPGYLISSPSRELLSTQLIDGTVEQIYKLESPCVQAVWPPRGPEVWYEKETWVPDGDVLRLASSVKGRLVPKHYEWEDEIDA